jgi:hypothetical protein
MRSGVSRSLTRKSDLVGFKSGVRVVFEMSFILVPSLTYDGAMAHTGLGRLELAQGISQVERLAHVGAYQREWQGRVRT